MLSFAILYSDHESDNTGSVDGAHFKNSICQAFDSYILKLGKWDSSCLSTLWNQTSHNNPSCKQSSHPRFSLEIKYGMFCFNVIADKCSQIVFSWLHVQSWACVVFYYD